MCSPQAALHCKLLLLFVACQNNITCTKNRAHIEDQNVDPAAPQKNLVRGEQSGCSLGEQVISSTIENPGQRRAIWMLFG